MGFFIKIIADYSRDILFKPGYSINIGGKIVKILFFSLFGLNDNIFFYLFNYFYRQFEVIILLIYEI